MKKITALNMNWNEYSEVVDKATEGKATLIITDGEWDYVCENGYELEVKEINEMVGKFLDIKIALQDEIQQISNLIANYFISIFRSINKTEYTVLDSYEEMPDFFKSVFLASDLVTLSSILAVVPKDYMFNLKFIKGAHLYVSQIIQRYQLASTLMDNFFRDLKK